MSKILRIFPQMGIFYDDAERVEAEIAAIQKDLNKDAQSGELQTHHPEAKE